MRTAKRDPRKTLRIDNPTRQIVARNAQHDLLEVIIEAQLIWLRRVVQNEITAPEFGNAVRLAHLATPSRL